MLYDLKLKIMMLLGIKTAEQKVDAEEMRRLLREMEEAEAWEDQHTPTI